MDYFTDRDPGDETDRLTDAEWLASREEAELRFEQDFRAAREFARALAVQLATHLFPGESFTMTFEDERD